MAVALPFIPTMIEALWAFFARLVMTKAGIWIAQILLTLGLEIGISAVFSLPFVADVSNAMGGIPGEIKDWMGVLNIDIYVSMIVSAYLIAHTRAAGRAAFLKAGRR